MKKTLLALVLVLGACGSSNEPADEPTPVPFAMIAPFALEPPPIYSLLGFRDRLKLTSEQITALDSIATAVQRENAPLVDTLRHRVGEQSRRRRGLRMDESERAMLEKVQQNNRQAKTAVGEVLTPEQETEACRLYDREDDDRTARFRREREEEERRTGRRTRPELDSLVSQALHIWPWCGRTGGGTPPA